MANSISDFGFKNPVIIDKNNVLVAGHTRVKAAKKLGNFYYYKITVLSLASMQKGKLEDHTIRTMNELSKEELKRDLYIN